MRDEKKGAGPFSVREKKKSEVKILEGG